MPDRTNDWYLGGLREDDPEVLRYIIDHCSPLILRWVMKNSGSRADGEDAAMYALEVLWKKSRSGNLNLTCAFPTFFFQLGKFWWLNQLRKKKRETPVTEENDPVFKDIVTQEKDLLESAERQRFLREKLRQLPENCQDLLRLFMQGLKAPEMAERLGISHDAARQRKVRCLGRLEELLRGDDRFSDLYDD